MKPLYKILSYVVITGQLALSCSNGGDEVTETENTLVPEKAVLLFPFNNTECHEGLILSDTETQITFEWEEATHATNYELILTDLSISGKRTLRTKETSFTIPLKRATPYSWMIRAVNGTNGKSSESETWRFYNAGLPSESHPPFPAEALYPKMGESIDPGRILVEWEASDIDGDIVSYDVFLDNRSSPEIHLGTTGKTSFEVAVEPEKVYYWKVMVEDSQGNISESPVFQFKTNPN